MQTEFHCSSPLGLLTLCSDGTHLTALNIRTQQTPALSQEEPPLPLFQDVLRWLKTYFSGGIPTALPPLLPSGTPFQQIVWKLLLKIPYGELVSYGAVAKQVAAALGKPRMSAQAVGGAVGRNPIPILIPCHRVIGSNGSLTGYTGGLAIKRALLRLEGVPVVNDVVPHFH